MCKVLEDGFSIENVSKYSGLSKEKVEEMLLNAPSVKQRLAMSSAKYKK